MASEACPAVEMVTITKRFGDVLANDAISFRAWAGEVHALLGENGAGKSTLMSILAGLYRPDAGHILIDGKPVTLRSPRDAIRLGIGMVYQHFMLVDALTVAENVVLGAREHGLWLDTAKVSRQLRQLSEQYGLPVAPETPVWQLSLGERQRVEIVRLLCYGARVLIFDEPTAVLTPQESAQLLTTLRAMAAQGLCIIFISHKLREVLAVADRITVLRRGQVVGTVAAHEADQRELARMMVGRDVVLPERRTPATPGPVLLTVSGLHVHDDRGRLAIPGLDLTVHAGEIVGIAGVAGNGQRELAEALAGVRRVARGSIRLGDRELAGRPPRDFIAAGISYVPEDRLGTGLVGGLPVWENAVLRAYQRQPYAQGPVLRRPMIRRFAEDLVQIYQIVPSRVDVPVGMLSGGNQQKLLLGRELAQHPRLLIAMHPTRGVDIGAIEAIYQLLLEQRAAGVGILLISEDLDEILALSDRIGVMYEGRLVGMVPAETAEREQLGLLMAGIVPGTTVTASPSASTEQAGW